MSQQEKLLTRFLSIPKDFTWDELKKILALFGYQELKTGKTGGSRRKFMDANKTIISLHKPHPTQIIKPYAIIDVIAHLKKGGI
jgi:hypothetical protein